ncbi:MAG TPA: hypothetical protein VFW21_00860 [Mycobacterium sp.]|nr:hypothetical protein [Mycobacterium sp.]
MTTHARPVEADADDGDASESTKTSTRTKVFMGLATAAIGIIPATIIALHSGTPSTPVNPTVTATASPVGATSAPIAITPTVIETSSQGWVDDVTVDGANVTVAGSARPDIESVVVMIAGRQSGGNYWFATADVHDQKWSVVVSTDATLPASFKTTVRYKERPNAYEGLTWRQGPSPTSQPAPPGVDANCVVQNGDACFTAPGWGAPSVFQSDKPASVS